MKAPRKHHPAIAIPVRYRKPTTRRGRERGARGDVSPTNERLLRKAEALGVSWETDRGGKVRIATDPHHPDEPLDALLHRKIITPAMHRAGAAFRNLRFAALGPVDPTLSGYRALIAETIGGQGLEDVRDLDLSEDPEERRARQHAAWKHAVRAICDKAGRAALGATVDVCVYAKRINPRAHWAVVDGLAVLVKRWKITDEG